MSRNQQNFAVIALSALSALSFDALSAPVQWTVAAGGNDHWYEFNQGASGGIVWTAARTAALASTHLGLQGYLATVTSAAEQNFLLGLSPEGWLGGSDAAVEGEWRWVDGPEAGKLFWTGGPGGVASGFTSWLAGEPNNNLNEDQVTLTFGRWNDLQSSATKGYYVEYGVAPPPQGVPLPGTLSLAGLAFGAACLMHRRRAVPGARVASTGVTA